MWEYKLYEKMFEKQQKLAADLIVYAQRTTPPSVKILKKARKYIHNFLFEQDHGPFEVQSATWKNFAVAWLTPPGALKEKDAGKCNVSCITLTIPRVASNFKLILIL